jgi:hypothetical protein
MNFKYKFFLIYERKIHKKKNQCPKAVIIASDNLPKNYAGTSFLGAGKFPFASKTIVTFLSLSAHIYDPLGSAKPNE